MFACDYGLAGFYFFDLSALLASPKFYIEKAIGHFFTCPMLICFGLAIPPRQQRTTL